MGGWGRPSFARAGEGLNRRANVAANPKPERVALPESGSPKRGQAKTRFWNPTRGRWMALVVRVLIGRLRPMPGLTLSSNNRLVSY